MEPIQAVSKLRSILEECKDIGPCYCDLLYGIVCPCYALRQKIQKVLEETVPVCQ